MSAERTRVGVMIHGGPQYYQRDREEKRNGKFVAVPFFVVDTSQAVTMSEVAARSFISRLRSLGVNNAWIEDCKDGRRIEAANETVQQSSGKDTRIPMKASLDDQNYFAVRPANTTEGPRWFVRCTVPGRPTEDVIYSETILGALQRAEDVGFLAYGERAPAPEPQAPAVKNSAGVVRRRPGSIR
jgi:hypothetical protein